MISDTLRNPLALFDVRAQEDVWSSDNWVLISSSYQPVGKVERVEGGFRLSGRWGFSSGCEHCGWVFLGSIVPPAPGETGPPDMRLFLPRMITRSSMTGTSSLQDREPRHRGRQGLRSEYRTHAPTASRYEPGGGNDAAVSAAGRSSSCA
jgi:hypothetical protein